MARRKGPRVTQFFNRDRLAFSAMYRVGHVTQDHLHQCGLADSRIKNLIRDGHIEKIPYKKRGKNEECYRLTRLGHETAARFWGLSYAYHAQSPTHDLAIADKYFSLPQELRESWITESQIRNQFLERVGSLREQGKDVEAKLYEDSLNKGLVSMPDAAYANESGQITGFEVITNSYGKEELMAKEELIQIMGYQYETTRV